MKRLIFFSIALAVVGHEALAGATLAKSSFTPDRLLEHLAGSPVSKDIQKAQTLEDVDTLVNKVFFDRPDIRSNPSFSEISRSVRTLIWSAWDPEIALTNKLDVDAKAKLENVLKSNMLNIVSYDARIKPGAYALYFRAFKNGSKKNLYLIPSHAYTNVAFEIDNRWNLPISSDRDSNHLSGLLRIASCSDILDALKTSFDSPVRIEARVALPAMSLIKYVGASLEGLMHGTGTFNNIENLGLHVEGITGFEYARKIRSIVRASFRPARSANPRTLMEAETNLVIHNPKAALFNVNRVHANLVILRSLRATFLGMKGKTAKKHLKRIDKIYEKFVPDQLTPKLHLPYKVLHKTVATVLSDYATIYRDSLVGGEFLESLEIN